MSLWKDNQEDLQLNRRLFRQYIVTALCLIVIVLTVFISVFIHYNRQAEARLFLGKAKNAYLSTNLLTLEQYSEAGSFLDKDSPYGVTKEIEREIQSMSGCTGTITLNSWDADTHTIKKLVYQEENLVGVYEKVNEQDTWNVYRITKVIGD